MARTEPLNSRAPMALCVALACSTGPTSEFEVRPAPGPADTPVVKPATPPDTVAEAESPEPEPAAPAELRPATKLTREEFDARWQIECGALTEDQGACGDTTDFDKDGRADSVAEVRALDATTPRVGLAVLWAGGTVSVIAEGTPVIATDVAMDSIDEERTTLPDISGVMQWRIVPRKDDGFVDPVRGRVFPAVRPTGTGLWVTTEDVAEIFYWDGEGLRELILGF